MTKAHAVTADLASEDDTADLGRWLAPRLAVGDCVLLQGPIGAGKSHLARALIRARLGRMEDIPSPTFTLVQTYTADVEIWHADLYRLSHPDEVAELGLEQAFSQAICLIEWPERLGRLTPTSAIRITLSTKGEGRSVTMDAPSHPDLVAAFAKDWAA
jgi:tRNA threonylcarbamoyladenosine biosynthesis protein TsaE